jgi:hypothetical protein
MSRSPETKNAFADWCLDAFRRLLMRARLRRSAFSICKHEDETSAAGPGGQGRPLVANPVGEAGEETRDRKMVLVTRRRRRL